MLGQLETFRQLQRSFGTRGAAMTLRDLRADAPSVRFVDDGEVVHLARDPSLAGMLHHLTASTPKLRNLASVVDPQDTVIFDVGAHSGLFAAFVKRDHPAARVVAYEPDPDLQAVIRLNLDRYDQCELVGKAVSDRVGEVTFHRGAYTQTGSLIREAVEEFGASQAITVPATTLDAERERLSVDRIDVLKLDIQGAEPLALAGARETLPRVGKLLIELSLLDRDLEHVLGQLRDEFAHMRLVNAVQYGADVLFSR